MKNPKDLFLLLAQILDSVVEVRQLELGEAYLWPPILALKKIQIPKFWITPYEYILW